MTLLQKNNQRIEQFVYKQGLFVKKNLLIMLRSRFTAALLIAGPLLLMLILGFAYHQPDINRIRIGVFTEEYTPSTQRLIERLGEQDFILKRFKSLENCIRLVEEGEVHVCINFPKDLQNNAEKKQEIFFYYDNSRASLAAEVLSAAAIPIENTSAQISKNVTELLLERLNVTQQKLGEQKQTLEEITQKLKDSSKKTKETKDKVAGISADVELKINVAGLLLDRESSLQTTGALWEQIKNNSQRIEASLNTLETLITRINTTNASEKQNIQNTSQEIKETLAALRNASDNSYKENTASLEHMVLAIEEIKNSLGQIETTLNSTKSVVQESNTGFEETGASIEEGIASLENMITAITQMRENVGTVSYLGSDQVSSPLTIKIRPLAASSQPLQHMFPFLLTTFTMICSMLLGALIVLHEKNASAYFRSSISPTTQTEILLSMYFAVLIVVGIELGIIVGVSFFFMHSLLIAFSSIGFILFLLATIFTLIGMAIGLLFQSEQAGAMASISIMLLMLLASGSIVPIEKMPYYAGIVAEYNPTVVGESMLRQTLLFGVPIFKIENQYNVFGTYRIVNSMLLCVMYIGILLALLALTGPVSMRKFKQMQLAGAAKYFGKAAKPKPDNSLTNQGDKKQVIQNQESEVHKKSKENNSPKKEEALMLTNGLFVHSWEDLIHLLPFLDEEIIEHHLQKKDMAKWVQESLHMKDAAEQIRKSTTKENLLKNLHLQ